MYADNRRACGDAAFCAFGHKVPAPNQPDQSLVALVFGGKAHDGMCQGHRTRSEINAGSTATARPVWAACPSGAVVRRTGHRTCRRARIRETAAPCAGSPRLPNLLGLRDPRQTGRLGRLPAEVRGSHRAALMSCAFFCATPLTDCVNAHFAIKRPVRDRIGGCAGDDDVD